MLSIVDGDILVADPFRFGSSGRDQGQAYLFDGATGQLKLTLDNPDPQFSDGFAGAIAGGDGLLFLSALGLRGRVYSFSAQTGQLLHTLHDPEGLQEAFGSSLAYGHGQLLVSNPSYTAQGLNSLAIGRTYLFDAGTGSLMRTVANPEPKRGDLFGFGRSLEVTDSSLIVGAIGDDLPGDTRPDGDNPGRVWQFDQKSGDVVRILENPNPESDLSDSFGAVVAANAQYTVVGAQEDSTAGPRGSGTVYVFDSSSGALRHTLFSPQSEFNGEFGRSLGLTADGDVLVGAFGTSVNGIETAGHAYLFDGETGRLLLDIPNPNPATGAFAYSVAALGNRLVVGAPAEGAIYVYEAIPEPASFVLVGSLLVTGLVAHFAPRAIRTKALCASKLTC